MECCSMFNCCVQVCRNVETGQSKGSAYVKMGSYNAAKNAVAALDGLVSHVKFDQCVFYCPYLISNFVFHFN
jgi:RNA recognition motif-containing protein